VILEVFSSLNDSMIQWEQAAGLGVGAGRGLPQGREVRLPPSESNASAGRRQNQVKVGQERRRPRPTESGAKGSKPPGRVAACSRQRQRQDPSPGREKLLTVSRGSVPPRPWAACRLDAAARCDVPLALQGVPKRSCGVKSTRKSRSD